MEKFTTLKKLKRKRKHGFLGLMRTHTGRNRILSRRAKGRKALTI